MLKLMTAMTGDRRFLETVASLPEGGNGVDITMSTVLDQIENNGMEKAKIMNFVTMVKDGLSIGKAIQYSGLSEDKVEEIIKKYNL